MSGIATAIVGSSIVSGISNNNALKSQERGASRALDAEERMYNQTREDQMPWLNAGKDALGTLTGDMSNLTKSFSANDFQTDPGYQFRLAEGQKALERSAAARGGLNSGAALKSLAGYNQGMASQEYQNAYNRFNSDRDQRFNKLSNIAGIGQVASNQLQNANTVSSQQQGDIYTGLGNAQAANQIANGNNINNLIGQGAQAATTYFGFSDERLKTNITPIHEADILEFKKTIKPYFFKYISDEYGEGNWAGIMAQDLEKSKLGRMAVVENDKGEKLVNFKKVVSIILASMAEGVA